MHYIHAGLLYKSLKFIFEGAAAHASVAPWEGVNALDAMVIAYTSISALRQQFRRGDQVHGVITNGGVKPNIIPAKTSAYYYLRCKAAPDMPQLKERVLNCFKAAALATGCQLSHTWVDKPYTDISTSDHLADLYTKNIAQFGITMATRQEQEKYTAGSTDMGNISYVVPSIHPNFAIPSKNGNHTVEFAAAAKTDDAHQSAWVAAKALTHTGVDLLVDPCHIERLRKDFETVHKRKCGEYVEIF